MKKIASVFAILALLATVPAEATNLKHAPKKSAPVAATASPASDGFLVCGLWVVPAHCSTQDRVIGSLVVGTAAGAAIGYLAAWSGASIAGGASVAATVQNATLIGAGIGAVGGVVAVATK
jgi:hypothetical protein